MAVIRMEKADLAKVSAADLMEYITENLECMRELVECGQIEPELWREAWEK